MNYLKNTFSIYAVFLLLFVTSSSVFAFSGNPPDELTGAPGEGTCRNCHAGNALNAAGGSLVLTVPGTYLPGEVYDIVVNLSRSGQSRWGFEMTALNSNGARAGNFATADANTQVSEMNSKQYIQHTLAGTAQGKRNTNSWRFKWTAPSTDVGQITFYAAGNAANNADFSAGDYIYTQKATSDAPVYGVTLAGVGALTKKTTDASAGVKYTLRVTNTGNTSDVVRLSSSGSVSATLSRSSVTLASGASANVTLTIPGSALTTAGDYAVKVKATSQGDSTKTAEITTTTTILPVYRVTLTGVGNLTRETTDASAGVSYTIRVRNSGNTNDTIRLATSGDATATVSPTSVFLNQGASRTVTLRISGVALAKAGDYAVKVKATSQGDNTKTAEITSTTTILPVYRVTLTGVSNLTRETTDASAGVSYTLRVRNSGNTNDTIRLATSGDATATVSPTSVFLNQGASRTVTLRISGVALAKAGDYAVKVKATSQGDNTKTAEITTTTTILPVYGVTLARVGDLTTETTDASEGVSYTLKVTNSGNTDDTINLVASGDAAATLSSSSVLLASGASTNVTLTISSDALATAGDYEVKVTATSQDDNAETAEITTTTTILPVYSVMLAGVGDLATATTDASEGVSYTLTITNAGNTDDVIDLVTSDDKATLSQTSVSLASGASTNVTLTISSDALATAGDYEVKVTATSQGDSTETAEITTTTTILPVYGVTLAGIGDLATATTDASEGVSYTLTITNAGNTDDVIDLATSDDKATLSQTSVSLASGASTEVTLSISADALAKAGDYAVKVKATSQGDSTKTAEITTTTTILPVYGVTLAGVGDLTTEATDASEGVSYTLTVTNSGNTDDTINLATSGDVTTTLSNASVPLASGASADVTLTISADALATAGDYEVKVTATSQGDNAETAEITTTTTILPVYGVTLAGVGDLTTETTDASEGVRYTLTITNAGNTDDVIDLATSGDVTTTLSNASVPLASGVSTNVTLTISADALAKAGDYAVKVKATSQGDNAETAEITTTTTILPVYGVTLVGVKDAEGEGVSYTLTITNTGNTDDVVDLATSGIVATLSQTSVPLAPGASADVTLTISDDALATAGDYEVKVTVTSQGDNTQAAETTLTTTTAAIYGVMLQGKGELEGATIDILAGVSYTLTITNTGNTDDTIVLGSSAEVGIEGSVLGSFRESIDQELAMAQLEIMLAPGASTEVIFTAAGDFFTKPGEYEIKVTATSQGDSTKTAEITTKTTMVPVYDVVLQGKGELEGATMDALTGVSYTLTVTNTGNTDDTIVLGSSAEVGIEGSVLGSFRESIDQELAMAQLEIALAPGASTEVIFTADGDFFTKPGEYEIKVTATSQGDSTKTAEITTKTTIEPVPEDLNADGAVNILDLVAVANQFGQSGEGLSGDVNMDGEVNILDLVQVASYLGKTQAEIVQANQ